MKREGLIKQMAEEKRPWDLLIIGGGATGLGVAVDASSRGYRVLLVEQHDFAKATSSRSTKLVHGGVRYLQQGDVSMVVEALHERGRLWRNARQEIRLRLPEHLVLGDRCQQRQPGCCMGSGKISHECGCGKADGCSDRPYFRSCRAVVRR